MSLKIAIAYKDGEIYEHFGHCDLFAVYEYADGDVNKCTKTLLDASALNGHQAMAELMKKNHIDAVMSGTMGGEAKAMLLSMGIVPVVGYAGDADTAADLLFLGRLPIDPGAGDCGCSGSCGSCGGCDSKEGCGCGCGSEEGGSCGCGCGH